MKITARGEHVVLELLEPPIKIGTIELPETKREEIRQRPIGVVVSVGPTANSEVGDGEPIEEGDVVCFWENWAGKVYGLDGRLLVTVRAQHIIGRVTDDKHATSEEIAAVRARHAKMMDESKSRRAASDLVVANGQVPRMAN